jgi:hypothetical protein
MCRSVGCVVLAQHDSGSCGQDADIDAGDD